MAFLVRGSINSVRSWSRSYASMSKKGLVLGVYSSEGKDEVKFTPYAQKYNESTAGKLLEQINISTVMF